MQWNTTIESQNNDAQVWSRLLETCYTKSGTRNKHKMFTYFIDYFPFLYEEKWLQHHWKGFDLSNEPCSIHFWDNQNVIYSVLMRVSSFRRRSLQNE